MTLDNLSGECFADDCDECTSPLCCCECHDLDDEEADRG